MYLSLILDTSGSSLCARPKAVCNANAPAGVRPAPSTICGLSRKISSSGKPGSCNPIPQPRPFLPSDTGIISPTARHSAEHVSRSNLCKYPVVEDQSLAKVKIICCECLVGFACRLGIVIKKSANKIFLIIDCATFLFELLNYIYQAQLYKFGQILVNGFVFYVDITQLEFISNFMIK